MITNHLLIKLKDNSRENVSKTRDILLSMRGKIQPLRSLQVEMNIRSTSSSYDLALIAQFASMEDLEAYLIDPVHVKVANDIAAVIEHVAAVCYSC